MLLDVEIFERNFVALCVLILRMSACDYCAMGSEVHYYIVNNRCLYFDQVRSLLLKLANKAC